MGYFENGRRVRISILFFGCCCVLCLSQRLWQHNKYEENTAEFVRSIYCRSVRNEQKSNKLELNWIEKRKRERMSSETYPTWTWWRRSRTAAPLPRHCWRPSARSHSGSWALCVCEETKTLNQQLPSPPHARSKQKMFCCCRCSNNNRNTNIRSKGSVQQDSYVLLQRRCVKTAVVCFETHQMQSC